MPIISESIDRQVMESFARGYSEHQIARMFNLRVAAVRRIRSEYSATFRKKQDALSVGERIHADLFDNDFRAVRRSTEVPSTYDLWREIALKNPGLPGFGTVTGRTPSRAPEGLHINPRGYEQHLSGYQQVDANYAGLEARVMAGFFTPNGQPTPAFWGFISQYVKKSGHTMLDILHDQEIFAPEQLERALDIYQQVDDMDSVQLAALLRVVAQKVYETNVKDPISTGTNVPDSE